MGNYKQSIVPTWLAEAKGTSLAREVFTSNFWMSGLAILKYIPRSFRVKQVDGMAFFTDAKHDEFRNRILRVTVVNPRQWGTMNVSQMLHHLNLACGGSLGFYTLPDESYHRLAKHSVAIDFLDRLVPQTTTCGARDCQKISRSPTTRNLSSISKNSSSENPRCGAECASGCRLAAAPNVRKNVPGGVGESSFKSISECSPRERENSQLKG